MNASTQAVSGGNNHGGQQRQPARVSDCVQPAHLPSSEGPGAVTGALAQALCAVLIRNLQPYAADLTAASRARHLVIALSEADKSFCPSKEPRKRSDPAALALRAIARLLIMAAKSIERR